jgi:hypothetical protein
MACPLNSPTGRKSKALLINPIWLNLTDRTQSIALAKRQQLQINKEVEKFWN